MNAKLNPQSQPQSFDKFKNFKVTKPEQIKGGNGEDPNDDYVLGSSDVADI